MRVRVLVIIGVSILAFGLVGVALTLAQSATPALDESRREAAAAVALEANPAPQLRFATVFTPPAVISGPLFIGADEANNPAYLIDPQSAASYPLFDGFGIWGSAFDAANRRVFFSQGPTLYEWPLDGSPALVGLMKGGVSGANLSMYGLAYYDGALYAARSIGSAADPKGIYTVDPATLSATLHITYAVDLDDIDVGGLAVDPDTGIFYGTNDAEDLRGLVQIDPNGMVTVLAPYPAGEDDIDGLAVGDGMAYLVPDEPGDIFVYDLAAMTYTNPITNPWTTSELFAGATWISEEAATAPAIALTKTVGTDANSCATTGDIAVPSGTLVTYCYEVKNTGAITVTLHDLDDSELGSILNDFPYSLAPAASAFITASAAITQTTVNTATWTAFNPGPTDVVTATDTATVTVLMPSINLTKTVGIDANACAAAAAITVNPGTLVTYCYTVENTGPITVTLHDLDDSELGSILNDFPYSLAPSASAFITASAAITQTTVNTATWTAYNPGPTDVVTATDTATVTVEVIATAADIAVEPASLAAELSPGGQLTRTLTIANTGNAGLTWTVASAVDNCGEPEALPWASFAPGNGATAPAATSELVVTFDAAGAPAGQTAGGILCISSNDPDEPVVVVPLSLAVDLLRLRLPVIIGSPQGGTR